MLQLMFTNGHIVKMLKFEDENTGNTQTWQQHVNHKVAPP